MAIRERIQGLGGYDGAYELIARNNMLAAALRELEAKAGVEEEKQKALLNERMLREQLMDQLSGLGTPSTRAQQLAAPRPGLAGALQGGQMLSNIAPGGQVGFQGAGGYQEIPGMVGQEPVGPAQGGIAGELYRKALGLPPVRTEAPEERRQFEQAQQKRGFEATEQRDVRLLNKELESRKLMAAQQQEHDLKVGSLNLMGKYAELTAAANRNRTIAKTNFMRDVRDPTFWHTTGLQAEGGKPIDAKTKQAYIRKGLDELDAEYRDAVNTANVYKLLAGRLNPQIVADFALPPETTEPGPNIEQLMRKNLSDTEYTILTVNHKVTPEKIRREATKNGISPEQYIQRLKDILYARQGK